MYEAEVQLSTWGRSEFDFLSLQDLAAAVGRGRHSHRQPHAPVARSRSEDTRPQYIRQDAPQYNATSPAIRRTRNHSPHQQRRAATRLPPSEPIYHDIEEERIYSRSLSPAPRSPVKLEERVNLFASPFHSSTYEEERIPSRSLSPARRAKLARSRERANLYPSPFHSPALHRQASIERLAVRATASKPTTRAPPSPQRPAERRKAHSHEDTLIMFSDPVDAASEFTGWSQQELIKKSQKEQAQEERRKDKRYGKKKDKKKSETRILNMPVSLNANNSLSKRKIYRGMDPLANDSLEKPVTKPRNLISKYAVGRNKSRTVTVPPATSCAVDPRKNWRISPSFSRSEGEMESTQSSHGSQEVPEVDNNVAYASLPITPSQAVKSHEDICAQAADEWTRSKEETTAPHLSDDYDAAEAYANNFGDAPSATAEAFPRDPRDPSDARYDGAESYPADYGGDAPFDESLRSNSNSSVASGSDEERPAEEDGSFPSLHDSRHSGRGEWGDKGIDVPHHPVESVAYSTTRYNHLSSATRGPGDAWDSCDKVSEESPVSVMAVHRAEIQRLYSAQATPARQNSAQHPRSILRKSKHNGAHTVQEYHKIIAGVRSRRVRFHDGIYQSDRQVISVEDTSGVRSGSHPSAHPNGFRENGTPRAAVATNIRKPNDGPQTEVVTEAPLSPIRHTEEFDQEENEPLSPIEEGVEEHTQYVPEVSNIENDIFGTDDFSFEPENDKDWEADAKQNVLDDPAVYAREQQAFDDPPLYGREVDGESIMSEFSEFGFMEAVAAIVIQTAVRRMLAIALMNKKSRETVPPHVKQFETMAVHMQELAAIDIQAAFRGWRSRDSLIVDQYAIAARRQEDAAIKIEAAFRGWWVRDSLNVDHFCARRIQRAYRLFRARMSFVFDLHRIVIVQLLWRRKMAESEAKQLRLASRPKSVTPSRQLPRVRRFLLEKAAIESAAAAAIQSRWRGYDAQMLYLYTLYSIITIQSIVRRWLTKPWLDRYLMYIEPPTRRPLKTFDEECSRREKHSVHRSPTYEAFGSLGEAVFATEMPALSVESSLLGTENDDEATADAQHCMPTPKMENPLTSVNAEETLTRENDQETNEHDRQNAKMSASVANFWRSRDKGSVNKALHHRKDIKPEVDVRVRGKIMPKPNIQAFFQSDESRSQANAVKSLVCGHCGIPLETECGPLTERKAAAIDVHGSIETKSPPLPTETEEGTTFHVHHCTTPPETENPPTGVNYNEDEMITKERFWEGDNQKAKDFWKSRDKGLSSKVSYRKKGAKPKLDDRIDEKIIPESTLQAFVHADDESNGQQEVNAVELDDYYKSQKTKLPSLAESKAAQVYVQRSREMESSPLPTETEEGTTFHAQHCITPPETENPPTGVDANENEMVTKKNLREGDKQKAKDFWKSREKDSASKVSYRRKGAKPKVDDHIDGGIIPESNLRAFVHVDDESNEQQQVHAVELENRDKTQKTKLSSLAEISAAQLDVLHGGEVESPPLPLETEHVATFVAQRIITQPETENPPTSANTQEDDKVTKGKVRETSNRQKMSTSAASFWKSRDKGTASKVLYRRRKEEKPVNAERDRGIPDDTEIPLLADSKPEVIGVQKMESRPRVTDTHDEAASDAQPRMDPRKMQSPPASEDMMANETTEEPNENGKYAKLSGSVADFWKLKAKCSASKSLYLRKDMQQVNQTTDWESKDGPNTST